MYVYVCVMYCIHYIVLDMKKDKRQRNNIFCSEEEDEEEEEEEEPTLMESIYSLLGLWRT